MFGEEGTVTKYGGVEAAGWGRKKGARTTDKLEQRTEKKGYWERELRSGIEIQGEGDSGKEKQR